MNYWPMSTLRHSPLMPGAFHYELENAHKNGLTALALQACQDVANRTPPKQLPHLAAVQTISGPINFLFIDYPEFEEWRALELAAIFQHEDVLYTIGCTLH